MSLATWGREAQEGDFLLPIVEYDDLDRTTELIPVEPPGLETNPGTRDSLCAALGRVQVSAEERGDRGIPGPPGTSFVSPGAHEGRGT